MSRRAFSYVWIVVVWWLAMPSGLAADGSEAGDGIENPLGRGDDERLAPRILSPADAARYRQIFRLGEKGEWHAVDALILELEDRLLVGHAQSQRYLHPWAYRSSFLELSTWLQRNEQHPDSERIRKLALKRMPGDGGEEVAPAVKTPFLRYSGEPVPRYPSPPAKSLNAGEQKRADAMKRRLLLRLRKGWTKSAKRLLLSDDATRLLSDAERHAFGAMLGHSYLVDGRYAWAIEWAEPATGAMSRYAPRAHWTVGLASWHLGKFAAAAEQFEILAARRDVSSRMQSAAAFWAARAHLYAKAPERVIYWLGQAGTHPWTFYGLLARQILGQSMPFRWNLSEAERTAAEAVLTTEPVRRALALVEVGQTERAEQEFLLAWRVADTDTARAILAIAERAGLSELALHLHGVEFPDEPGIDVAAYPLPAWAPREGFVLDRALVYAVIHKESRFDVDAESFAGARGLMQLMPATARYVARRSGEPVEQLSQLHKPAINLEFGQRYLTWLLNDDVVKGDLLLAAAAWNGGIGNVRKWIEREELASDPLLFIESIPLRETRRFVKSMFANLWIYRHRLAQPSPTLEALAAGKWPTYQALDSSTTKVEYHDDN